MKKTTSLCLILVMSLFFSSCAMLFRSSKTIQLQSNPAGADVVINGNYIGQTPCSYTSKSYDGDVTMRYKDYQPVTITPEKKSNGLAWLDLFCFPPVGIAELVAGTGSYKPSTYTYDFTDIITQEDLNRKQEAIRLEAERRAAEEAARKAAEEAAEAKRNNRMTLGASAISAIKTTTSSTVLSSERLFKKYNPAVFMIFTSDGTNEFQGSGFFITSSGIAVSNYHVFKGTGKGLEVIKTVNGKEYKVSEVLAYSEENDYIVFKVNGSNFSYIPVTKRGFTIGEKVYALGSPKGMENTFSDGMVSQDRGNGFIQISVPIDHGSSGGALINKYGEVIGITSGGMDTSGANLNYARDIRLIFNK